VPEPWREALPQSLMAISESAFRLSESEPSASGFVDHVGVARERIGRLSGGGRPLAVNSAFLRTS
jgi:hypothetical protein